jgi:hypothetical protein
VCGRRQIEDKSEPVLVNIWARTEDRGQRNLGTEQEEACASFFLWKRTRVGASIWTCICAPRGMHFTGHRSSMCKMDSHSYSPPCMHLIISLTDAWTPLLASSPTTVQMHMEMHSVVGDLTLCIVHGIHFSLLSKIATLHAKNALFPVVPNLICMA